MKDYDRLQMIITILFMVIVGLIALFVVENSIPDNMSEAEGLANYICIQHGYYHGAEDVELISIGTEMYNFTCSDKNINVSYYINSNLGILQWPK